MKKTYISIALLMALPSIVNAQTDLKDIINKNIPNVTTPELTRFLRYNDFPDIQFVGGTNIEIPIYSIKLNDLEIPIKLTYNTKGNKISEIASNVGLGWTLIANGNISKQINDIEDFSYDEAYFLEDPHSQYEPAPPIAMRTVKGYFTNDIYYSIHPDFKIDSAPDSYIVNAPGLKTKFYLQKDPTICPQNDCGISVYRYIPTFLDVNTYKMDPLIKGNGGSIQEHRNPVNAFQNITLYNGKGYEYSFINPSGVRLTKPSAWNNGSNGLRTYMGNMDEDQTNTWYLDYIKSPTSQKKIEYIYENYTINYENPIIQASGDGFGQLGLTSNWFKEGTAPTPYTYSAQDIDYLTVIWTTNFGNKRLKKINFDEGSVYFYYTTRQDYDDKSLSQILVTDKSGKIIKTVDFYYSYFLPKDSNCSDNYNCLRLRLDKIVDSNNGEYRFNYGVNNSDNVFPKRSSSKTDYLGYFNDNSSDISTTIQDVLNDSNNQLTYPMPKMYYYPDLTKDNFLPIKLNGVTNYSTLGTIDKTPNEKSLIGLLSRIIYPTQGTLNIEYENDDFEYLGNVYKTGSARVKKMKYYGSDNTLARQIEYSYKNENGISSGQVNYFKPPIPTQTTVVTSYDLPLEFNKDGVVGYSRIEEIETGKGKKVKKYSNISDFPDNLPIINPNGCSLTANETSVLKRYKFPFKNIEDHSNRRGNLTYEGYFKEGSTSPVYEAFNTYDYYEKTKLKLSNTLYKSTGVNSVPGDYSTDPGCSFLAESYLITNQVNLISSTKKTYYTQGIVQASAQNIYEPNKNELKKTINTSSSGIIETNYKNSEDKGITKLINNNIIDESLEIETIKKKDINDGGKMISKSEIKYDDPSNLLPSSIKSYNLDNVAETAATYDKYDSKGNLQQYTTKDGVPTSIIWGYNGTQPIAKIEGATYSQVENFVSAIVSASDDDALDPNKEGLLITALNTFRNSLPTYQITTYTYDPLIGVTSITPPSGIREVYTYDSANRLESVKDINGKLLKELKYNYKH